jgi:hypothetical protein
VAIADAAKAERIAELVALEPYGKEAYRNDRDELIPGKGTNMTLALELEMLDPARAAKAKAEALPVAASTGISAEECARVNAAVMQARIASLAAANPSQY